MLPECENFTKFSTNKKEYQLKISSAKYNCF